MPLTINILLEESICHDAGQGIRHGIRKKRSISQSVLDTVEGSSSQITPVQIWINDDSMSIDVFQNHA